MSARDLALYEIDRRDLPGWPAGAASFKRPPGVHDGRDLGLGEQIATGVVKNLLLLKDRIAHHAGRPVGRVDVLTQKVLAIGLYQLRALDRVPKQAAVSEAVEQAKRHRLGRAAGFVNAVLRKAADDPRSLPHAMNAADVAELHLSMPRPTFRSLAADLGEAAALDLARHALAEPPTLLRPSAGVSVADLTKAATSAVAFAPHDQSPLLVVSGAKKPDFRRWAEAGLAQVQDATAAAVVDLLDVRPGMTALDRCCGLGTKTLQLVDRVGPTGRVVGIDPDGGRLAGLREVLQSRGVGNVALVRGRMLADLPPDAADAIPPGGFDRVLVDAPCSNSGVLARRPEAKYHQSPAALASLVELQHAILDDTAPHVAPGGLMAYSTCSVWPAENAGVADAFLSRHPDFAEVSRASTLPAGADDPQKYRDGGFVAVMRRAG